MFVDVIPAIRATKGVDTFTYRVDVESGESGVHVGHIVWIPWRSSHVMGVIAALDVPAPPTHVNVKPIKQVTEFVLPKAYLDWMYWFADYYALPLSTTAKTALPEVLRNTVNQLPVASDLTNVPADTTHSWRVKKEDIPAIQLEVKALLDAINSGYTSLAVIYRQPAQVAAMLQGLAKYKKRLMIIVPEEHDAFSLAKTLAGLKPLVLDTGWNKRQQQAWLGALHEPMICIGTRRLSLLPLTTADAVIVIDPENGAHKQWDQQPRYHAWQVAKQQAKLANIPLLTFSQALPLMALQSVVNNNNLVHSPFESDSSTVRIIDMRGEPQLYERGHISFSILQRLEESRFSVLWINRKGDAHWLVCRQCGWSTNDFTVNNCAKCRSLDLQKRGFGLDTICAYLRAQFPSYSVVSVTSETQPIVSAGDKPTIVVGTQAVMQRVPWPQVEYAAVLSIDQQLTRPDYSAIETAYGYLAHLRNVSPQLDIQTTVPEHPLFSALTTLYPAEWLQTELRNRKSLALPPFVDRIVAWPAEQPDNAITVSSISAVDSAFPTEKIVHIDRQV